MITKVELAKSIVNLLLASGQEGAFRLYLLGPRPSKAPAFDETPASYVKFLVGNHSRRQLLTMNYSIVTDPSLED